jgi:hypothetical protein
VTAKELVDRQFVTLDLGESHEVEGVVLPRFSVWKLNKFGIPEDLIALSQALPVAKTPISEATSKLDRDDVVAIVRKEIKAAEKRDKKDDEQLIKNALISLFKTFYTKRSFWAGDISVDRTS